MPGGGGGEEAPVNSCSICSKSFGARYLLSRHLSTHSGQRNFLCCVCGKAFLQGSALSVHIASHRSPSHRRLYDCDVCAKQFRRSSTRNIHRASHEQKMHICSYCGKAFHQKSTLKTHELIHTDSKPFLCNFCDQTFRQNSNLKVHISKQHHNVTAAEKNPKISPGVESLGSSSNTQWADSTNADRNPENLQLENTFGQKKKKSRSQPRENIDHLKVERNNTSKTLKRKLPSQEQHDSTVVSDVAAVAIGSSNSLKFARNIKSDHISTTTDRLPLSDDNSCLQTVRLRPPKEHHNKSIALEEVEPLNASDAINDSKVDVGLHAFPLDTEDAISNSNKSVNSPCCKSHFTDGDVEEESDGNCQSQFSEDDEEVSDDVLAMQCSGSLEDFNTKRPLTSEIKVSPISNSDTAANPSNRRQMTKIPGGDENIHTKPGIGGVMPISSGTPNGSLGFIADLNDRVDVATRITLESCPHQMFDQQPVAETAKEENSTDTSTDNLSVVENILANVYQSSNLTGAIIRQSDCLGNQGSIRSDFEDAKYVKNRLRIRSRPIVGTRNHPPPRKLLYVHFITPEKPVKNFIWNCSVNTNRTH